MGATVLAAWKLELPAVLQPHPSLAPMAFNSALWMALSGAALVLTTARAGHWAVKALGAMVAATAAATLGEHLFATRLGLDEAFQQAAIVPWQGAAGRPTAHSAAAFALTGLALLLHDRPLSVVRCVLIGLFGSAVIALASVSLFAYTLAPDEGLPWLIGSQPMSMHAAVGLMSVGGALAILAWFVSDQAVVPRWVPVAIGLVSLMATAALWQGAIAAERRHVKVAVQQQAVLVRDALAHQLSGHVNQLVRMAQRWGPAEGVDELPWRADAALYIAHDTAYRSVEWRYADGRARWIEPVRGVTDGALRRNEADPARDAAIRRARESRRPVLEPGLGLDGQRPARAFLVVVPVLDAGRFEGSIVGALDADEILVNLFGRDGEHTVEVLRGNDILQAKAIRENAASRAYASAPLPVGLGTDWSVRVVPGAALFERDRSSLPTAVLVASLLIMAALSVTSGAILSSITRARRETRRLAYLSLRAAGTRSAQKAAMAVMK